MLNVRISSPRCVIVNGPLLWLFLSNPANRLVANDISHFMQSTCGEIMLLCTSTDGNLPALNNGIQARALKRMQASVCHFAGSESGQ